MSSAAATGTMANTATVTPGSGETNTTGVSVSATDTDTLTPTVDLAISQTDNAGGNSSTAAQGTVVPGNAVTYTITVTNTGPSNVVAGNVADVLPSAIASDTYTAAGTTGASGFTASGSGNINDTVNLATGSSITYTVVANVDAAATGTLSQHSHGRTGDRRDQHNGRKRFGHRHRHAHVDRHGRGCPTGSGAGNISIGRVVEPERRVCRRLVGSVLRDSGARRQRAGERDELARFVEGLARIRTDNPAPG